MRARLPSGVRWRTTLGAMAVTALALLVAGALLLWVLGNNLEANLDATVENQATDRAQLIDGGADPTTLVAVRQSESLVWIGEANGTPLAVGGTYQIVGTPPDLAVGASRASSVLVSEDYGDRIEQEQADVRIAVAQAADGTLVLVGAELETITNTTGEVRNLLLIGLPLLLMAVGALTWVGTGRALRPVEEIRATAEAIGTGALTARVPEPGTNDEVQQLAVTMNGMLDRLHAQQRAQRRFIADASHELKSPVANLRAVVDTTQLDDARWPQTQARLVSESDRLTGIVDNLLFMAVDDERGGTAPVGELVNIDDILFDEAELLAARSNIVPDIGGVEPCEVRGNADQLRRVVRNLVQNAERHGDTLVSFSCRAEGDTALFCIADDGPGVPADQREVIFERFGRADEARDRKTGGTGLGLAIVASIIESHGGTVSVDDGPDGGARFTVRLDSQQS